MALIGGGLAALLSLLVLSRVIADNPCYRLAQYLLVGASLGLTAATLLGQTVFPPLQQLARGQSDPRALALLVTAGVLLIPLLTRFGRQRGAWLSNIPLAIIFGTGAGVALIGVVRGTLVPQLLETVAQRRLQGDAATLLGTLVLITTLVLTLWSFQYAQAATPSRARHGLQQLARGLVLVSFGVFLALAVRTYLAALAALLATIGEWIAALSTLL
ncbi:hypothetical protein [Kallotenue papyrolyticum]|uniref:hypothetical protein n=1 Tax=Kallotenue papyrolyticum TaxID=1325125 RepID=UPI00047862AD|nr:hypothetical protein [Kallotenue papyrolyticum]